MYRVFLFCLLGITNFCHYASGYHTDYSSNTDEDTRNFSEDNDDDVDIVDEYKTKLMGLDYYGGDGFRNDLHQNSNEHLQMAGPNGPPDHADDSRYESDPYSKKNIVILDSQDARNYKAELLAGNRAEVLDANPQYHQPDTYPDYGRRLSVPPFIDVTRMAKNVKADEPVPVLAPPEMVIAIAKQSALLNAAEPKNPTDAVIRKDILRTGNYWNAFWTEDVNPQLLRENNEKQLDTIKVEVRPQSELYDLILKLKQMSPTLLYVINNTI